MRVAPLLFALAFIPLTALSSGSGCGGTSGPSSDAGGSTFPVSDGAACGCATPDCLPSCSDLPPCKLQCTVDLVVDGEATGDGGAGGGTLLWLDACGLIQYAESCPSGCVNASTLTCH